MKTTTYIFKQKVRKGKITVEEALMIRKSVRDFRKAKIPSEDLGLLLWAAYGLKTLSVSSRTAPSAGACYPLMIYAVIGREAVEGIEEGIYLYVCDNHSIVKQKEGDVRKELAAAAFGQTFIKEAPISIAISADFSKTTSHYGERGIRYVYIDLGHAAQNVYLQATALGMGTVAVGAFRDNEVSRVLSLPKRERPLYIMPIGFPA